MSRPRCQVCPTACRPGPVPGPNPAAAGFGGAMPLGETVLWSLDIPDAVAIAASRLQSLTKPADHCHRSGCTGCGFGCIPANLSWPWPIWSLKSTSKWQKKHWKILSSSAAGLRSTILEGLPPRHPLEECIHCCRQKELAVRPLECCFPTPGFEVNLLLEQRPCWKHIVTVVNKMCFFFDLDDFVVYKGMAWPPMKCCRVGISISLEPIGLPVTAQKTNSCGPSKPWGFTGRQRSVSNDLLFGIPGCFVYSEASCK